MFLFFIGFFLLAFGKPLALVGGGVAIWMTIRLLRSPEGPRRRDGLILLATGVLVGAPVLGVATAEYRQVLARVPEPLRVASIEYRREEDGGGLGLPGDNEAGFVVYKLTRDSARWARTQGAHLPDELSPADTAWHATPLNSDSVARWSSDVDGGSPEPTIARYLNRYGFGFDVNGHDDPANQAMRSQGSFYSFGRGGSMTIVDPVRGKVYFAYAG